MSASIEKSLYIGILKTRFDLWDEVKLKLKSGEVVQGTIEGFEGNRIVQIDTADGFKEIKVDDIEDYISAYK